MKPLPILFCLLALAGCSHKAPEPQADKPVTVATPWDGMKADEQRAKDVQKIVDKQAAGQRKQIEAQTR